MNFNVNTIPDGSIPIGKLKDSIQISLGKADTALQEHQKLAESITYAELVSLRDNDNLVAGKFYRIIDYECTTINTHTTSAGHQFDIIVVADDESHLNESAYATQHNDDTYFANCDLNAWELKYSLDNDNDRFDWADTTNGKGVIYYMKDEFNNECCYDFKNIQFYRKWNTDRELWCNNASESDGIPCYTFSSEGYDDTIEFEDYSLNGIENKIYNNKINPTTDKYGTEKYKLNNICFFGTDCYSNELGINCYDITIDEDSYENYIGSGCYKCSFKEGFENNFIEGYLYNSYFDDWALYNHIGVNCSGLKIGDSLYACTIGNDCSNIKIGDDCYAITIGNWIYSCNIGDACENITMNNKSSFNEIGDTCENITICNNSTFNEIGNDCKNITIGNGSEYNIIGNDCENITFRSGCTHCILASDEEGTPGDYFLNIIFDNGVGYCILYNNETLDSTNRVSNYHIKSSIVGGYRSYKTIEATRNNVNDTEVAINSDGELVQYCCADSDGGGSSQSMIEITYAELVALRNNSGLTPGMQYRITNYVTTTTESGTTSANHPFDVIVLALDDSHLSEEALAIQHEGDTYFANSNLAAWKIWYCLDNDINRFAWANHFNAKGVIYRMIDEFGNDCPYDFKNIQFYRKWNSTENLWCDRLTGSGSVPAFTFSSNGTSSTTSFTDYSLDKNNNVHSNIIKSRINSEKQQELNNTCFFDSSYCNTFGDDCYNCTFSHCHNNAFGDNCAYNIFGDSCYDNIFSNECSSNTFGSNCYYNMFGSGCGNNKFGNNCFDNTFGSGCGSNKLGNNCSHNAFGNTCVGNTFSEGCNKNVFNNYSQYNTFGYNCVDNAFGNDCQHNTFKGNCSNNTFDNNCVGNAFSNYCTNNKCGNNYIYNTLGSYCQNNTFGNNCQNNIFGSSCFNNTFGDDCRDNTFSSSSDGTNVSEYFYYNTIESGVKYCIIYNTDSASSYNLVKNYHIKSSIVGTSSAKIAIEVTRGRNYDTTVAKNSAGTVKSYCEADLA